MAKVAPGQSNLARGSEYDMAVAEAAQMASKAATAGKGGQPSRSQRMRFWVENMASANDNAYFYLLIVFSLVAVVVYGLLWKLFHQDIELTHAFFFMFQLIASGGIDSSVEGVGAVITFILALFFQLVIFAILVGIITEKFQAMIDDINAGKTPVACSNHTVILGWNETTMRLVCQLAFVRRGWRVQNETFARRLFPWLRVPASTPVAKGSIIVLCDNKTKEDMQQLLSDYFEERGVSKKRTRVGVDVLCRVGDPTNIQDLERVGVHRATAIVFQMGESDREEEEASDGYVKNGATFRSLLAVRHLLLLATPEPNWDDLRVVIQLSSPSQAIEAALFTTPHGRPCVSVQDLSMFLNSLMFNCLSSRGMADVLNDLLGFEGAAFRVRKVKDFVNGGKDLVGKKFSELKFMFDNAYVVGVSGPKMMDKEEIVSTEGFVPSGSRVITIEDRLMFVSHVSNPTRATRHPPDSFAKGPVPAERVSSTPLNVLICGWRPEWNGVERFAWRLRQTHRNLPIGSHIMFVCTLDEPAFENLMKGAMNIDRGIREADVGDENGWTRWSIDGELSIAFLSGDAAVIETLRAVVDERIYDSAILLTSMANGAVTAAKSRDTRMLTIMLFLRYLQSSLQQPPMHVIGENALDITSALALGPKFTGVSNKVSQPDFVNVHAICARALCQATAYPFMAPSLSQLFSNTPGMPRTILLPVGSFVPLGKAIPFAMIVRAVSDYFPEDVCVGVRNEGGRLLLAPDLWQEEAYEQEDWVIIITRRIAEGSRTLPSGDPAVLHIKGGASKATKVHKVIDPPEPPAVEPMVLPGNVAVVDLPGVLPISDD
eukprot:TRINITY_DN4197_c0_g1_i4.p1 TRINITY_DN4197_c0_g1~~TRINITY_DN4197_c0_g1_i4.p1  ORF type:complete len:829 (-),score=89.97 TRINITY_DN4197_c0_g1_i4:231-2717(-)